MRAPEVTATEFKQGLGPNRAREVDDNLAAGRGTAMYGGGQHQILMSYGTRDSDFAGHPPAALGDGLQLQFFCPPPVQEQVRQSPVKAWKQPHQAPTRWFTPQGQGQTVTERPTVTLSRGGHADTRGPEIDRMAEYRAALPPGRESAPLAQPMSETSAWYARKLGR